MKAQHKATIFLIGFMIVANFLNNVVEAGKAKIQGFRKSHSVEARLR